jgi:single-stranded DNA-binding protein
VNVVCLSGKIAGQPKTQTTKSGKEFATFSLSVKHPFFEDSTSVFQCVAWRKALDVVRGCNAGTEVAVSGSLEQRKFTGKDGTEREVFSVSADNVEVLVYGAGAGAGGRAAPDERDDPFSDI